jgi:hypothetical protein
LRPTGERGERLFGFGETHPAFPVSHKVTEPVGSVVGVAAVFAAVFALATTRSAGCALTLLRPRLVGAARGASATATGAEAGTSPTTRSAGSGAILPITRRVRARRAVLASM